MSPPRPRKAREKLLARDATGEKSLSCDVLWVGRRHHLRGHQTDCGPGIFTTKNSHFFKTSSYPTPLIGEAGDYFKSVGARITLSRKHRRDEAQKIVEVVCCLEDQEELSNATVNMNDILSDLRTGEPLEKKRISRGFCENYAFFDFEFSIYMYYIKAICRDVKIYKLPQNSATLIWADF